MNEKGSICIFLCKIDLLSIKVLFDIIPLEKFLLFENKFESLAKTK